MAQRNNLIFKWSYDPRSYESNRPIGLIHDSRHVSFQIVMQISHVLCWGGNIEKKANCGKSARRNIESTLKYWKYILKFRIKYLLE